MGSRCIHAGYASRFGSAFQGSFRGIVELGFATAFDAGFEVCDVIHDGCGFIAIALFSVIIWFDEDSKAIAFERYLKAGSGHAFANRHFW